MYCKSCGNQLGENANFCAKCGKPTNQSRSDNDIDFGSKAKHSKQHPPPKTKTNAIILGVVSVVIFASILTAIYSRNSTNSNDANNNKRTQRITETLITNETVSSVLPTSVLSERTRRTIEESETIETRIILTKPINELDRYITPIKEADLKLHILWIEDEKWITDVIIDWEEYSSHGELNDIFLSVTEIELNSDSFTLVMLDGEFINAAIYQENENKYVSKEIENYLGYTIPDEGKGSNGDILLDFLIENCGCTIEENSTLIFSDMILKTTAIESYHGEIQYKISAEQALESFKIGLKECIESLSWIDNDEYERIASEFLVTGQLGRYWLLSNGRAFVDKYTGTVFIYRHMGSDGAIIFQDAYSMLFTG